MRPTFNQIRELGDFATTVNWYLQFTEVPKGFSTADFEDLNIRCESTSVPKREGNMSEVQIRGLPVVHQPGLYLPETTWSCSVVETVDNKVTNLFQRLVAINYEQGTGKALPKKDCQCKIRIVRLNRQDEEIYEYELIGAYLSSYETGADLQGSSADIIKPSLTFTFDDFTEKSLPGAKKV